MKNQIHMVFCTAPLDYSEKIAEVILKEKLGACINVIPKISSFYIWNNEVCKDEECLLIVKSPIHLFSQLKSLILKIHPYDLPEIISTSIHNTCEEYEKWVVSSCQLK